MPGVGALCLAFAYVVMHWSASACACASICCFLFFRAPRTSWNCHSNHDYSRPPITRSRAPPPHPLHTLVPPKKKCVFFVLCVLLCMSLCPHCLLFLEAHVHAPTHSCSIARLACRCLSYHAAAVAVLTRSIFFFSRYKNNHTPAHTELHKLGVLQWTFFTCII